MYEFEFDIEKIVRMKYPSARFKGGGGSTTTSSKFLPEQDALLKQVISQISGQVGTGATAFTGETLAETPDQFGAAVERFETSRDELSPFISETLAARSRGELNISDTAQNEITDFFQESFAKPAFQMFREEGIPTIRENFEGGLFSTRLEDQVGSATAKFAGAIAQPLLQAQLMERQAADARQAGALQASMQLPSMQFQQDIMVSQAIQAQNQAQLTDAYNEFLRLAPENDPWLQLSMQAAGIGSSERLDTIVKQGSGGMNTTGAIAGGVIGGILLPSPVGIGIGASIGGSL